MVSWQSYVAAHMDYETEYSQVMSALNDVDAQLSQCTELHDMDRCAVEELSARLQVLTVVLFVTVKLVLNHL